MLPATLLFFESSMSSSTRTPSSRTATLVSTMEELTMISRFITLLPPYPIPLRPMGERMTGRGRRHHSRSQLAIENQRGPRHTQLCFPSIKLTIESVFQEAGHNRLRAHTAPLTCFQAQAPAEGTVLLRQDTQLFDQRSRIDFHDLLFPLNAHGDARPTQPLVAEHRRTDPGSGLRAPSIEWQRDLIGGLQHGWGKRRGRQWNLPGAQEAQLGRKVPIDPRHQFLRGHCSAQFDIGH